MCLLKKKTRRIETFSSFNVRNNSLLLIFMWVFFPQVCVSCFPNEFLWIFNSISIMHVFIAEKLQKKHITSLGSIRVAFQPKVLCRKSNGWNGFFFCAYFFNRNTNTHISQCLHEVHENTTIKNFTTKKNLT